MTKTKIKAFSLIEILITFVIIAIVAALGLQGLSRVKDQTRANTVLARLKQLDIAKQQYIAEYGRLEASLGWHNARIPSTLPAGDISDARYDLLKRYIERPQYTMGDVVPDSGCTIMTPSSVFASYTGIVTMDTPYTVNNQRISQLSITDH